MRGLGHLAPLSLPSLPAAVLPCVLTHFSNRNTQTPSRLQLLELVREEVKGCTDVPRLHAAAGVLCQLAGGTEPVRSGALRSALILLANRYPKVGRRLPAVHSWGCTCCVVVSGK